MFHQPQAKPVPEKAQPGSHPGSSVVDPEDYSQRWEMIWEAGLEPGQQFDVGFASQALEDLLSRPDGVDVRGKRVVVPGCGRGYDVTAFARHGAAQSVGLELSLTAAASAEQYLQGVLQKDPLPAGCTAHVVQADFFRHVPESSPPYDVGYDYTFGCAMHPSMRQDWAQQWARTIAQGGKLITLIFPDDPSKDPEVGPPFVITHDLFKALLEPVGFTCTFSQRVPDEQSIPPRKGKEWMSVWVRS